MDWFRWYAGTVTDPKWRVISRRSGQPLHVVLAVWAAVLENANQSEARGALDAFDVEDVGAALDLEGSAVQAVLDAMQGKVLEGTQLSGWEKRQPKREREDRTAAERKRRQRERQRDDAESRQVTPSHALEESRVEEITTTPSVSPPEGETQTTPIRTPRKAPGRMVPADFTPKSTHRDKADALGLDVDEEAEAFVTHHRAKGTLFADVDLGFFTWLRNAKRFGGGGGRTNGAGTTGQVIEMSAERIAAWEKAGSR